MRRLARPALACPFLAVLSVVLLAAGCGGKHYDDALQTPNFNYGEVLDGHMMRAEQALKQVRDLTSAQEAAARIRLINQDLADVVYNAPRLSEDGQIELGRLAAGHLTRVQRLQSEFDQYPPLAGVLDEDLDDLIGYLTVMVSGNYEDSPVN